MNRGFFSFFLYGLAFFYRLYLERRRQTGGCVEKGFRKDEETDLFVKSERSITEIARDGGYRFVSKYIPKQLILYCLSFHSCNGGNSVSNVIRLTNIEFTVDILSLFSYISIMAL